MGTLRDEVYEKLDYLSQLTEVVISPQNEILAHLPDRLDLTFEEICNNKMQAYGGGSIAFEIHVSNILVALFRETLSLTHLDYDYIPDIASSFKLEVSSDFEIDFESKQMTGNMTLFKVKQQLDEKEILTAAIVRAVKQLSSYRWPQQKRLRDKIATVLNTLEPNKGTEWAKTLQGRASWSGQNAIKDALTEIILENKWRIRDTAIIIKMGEWINAYLSDDTDQNAGLVNLLKLRIMVDKDLPIYSIDEVPNVYLTY